MRKYRIGIVASVFLVVTAAIFDLAQAAATYLIVIPLMGVPLAFVGGIIVNIFAWLFFAICFFHLHVSLMRDYPFGFLGTLVMENAPFINALPGWSVFVIRTIRETRLKDRLASDAV